MIVKNQFLVAWFFIVIGFSILISAKIKLTFVKIGIGLSLIITVLTVFLLNCTLPVVVVVWIYPISVFFVITLVYFIFIKQE